jgi:hypothetical protein
LTIKNSTHPVAFDITVNGNTATTAFKVDRTKYDINMVQDFFDNLGDKAISDEFELAVFKILIFFKIKTRILNKQLLGFLNNPRKEYNKS